MTVLSVIVPANNEAGYIAPCLEALRIQDINPKLSGACEIVVAANACTDATVAEVEAMRPGLEAAGWQLCVLDLETPGKLNALNHAEEQALGRVLVYLDADVVCDPSLMRLLVEALDKSAPGYASGTLKVAAAQSWVTRQFARVWTRLPFMTTNVQGAGLFAVNRSGRARWEGFPDIIADDGFVRLMFAPEERIKVAAAYHWPMVEGFAALVKVRRRQDAGVRELAERFPDIMVNESKPPMRLRDHLGIFVSTPVSYVVYVLVMIVVKFGPSGNRGWARGR